jgi:hypothetical protein
MRGTDRRRRPMIALDAINRRVGRDSDFYACVGIHRDRKAFAAPVLLILPELRPIRSGSPASTRARRGLAEPIRLVGNRLSLTWTRQMADVPDSESGPCKGGVGSSPTSIRETCRFQQLSPGSP